MKTHLCDVVQDRLSFYVDNSLTEVERSEIEAHLNMCGDCRSDVEAYTRLRQGLATLRQQQQSLEPPQKIWRGAKAEWDAFDSRRLRSSRMRVALAGACLLLFAMGVSWARLFQANSFPVQVVLKDFEQFSADKPLPTSQMETSDAGRASDWLKRQIGGDIPPVPLNLSGAKLVGAGVLSQENAPIGRLVYQTPKGVLVLYVAPHRTSFAGAKQTVIDGRNFYASQPTPNMTLLAWEYNAMGMGMMASMKLAEVSPYALDARRLTNSLP